MAPLQFPNVKDEKANAMRRYRRERKVGSALRLFNICAAVFVFSRSSWFPIVVELFSHFYGKLAVVFNNPLYVFFMGNLIILFVYALSDQMDRDHGGRRRSDVYDEFLDNCESPLKITVDCESPVTVINPEACSPGNHSARVDSAVEYSPEKKPETLDCSDKQVVCSEGAESPVSEETVTAVSETRMTTTTTTTTSCCTTVSRSTDGGKVSEKKCYRRVQSESYKRRIVVGPQRDLKRSNTELSREVVRYGGELQRRLGSVEELSNEDFNRTVEDFIAKHKKMQWEEQRESRKTQYLALTQQK